MGVGAAYIGGDAGRVAVVIAGDRLGAPAAPVARTIIFLIVGCDGFGLGAL